jgi:hypothetical protein
MVYMTFFWNCLDADRPAFGIFLCLDESAGIGANNRRCARICDGDVSAADDSIARSSSVAAIFRGAPNSGRRMY